MSIAPEIHRGEGGAALLVTMMILIALALLGMTTLQTVMSDQQVSGYQTRSRMAFQAAEAGLAVVRGSLDGTNTPTIAAVSLADAATYPHGQPSYGPDPNIAQPVTDMGASAAQGMNLRIGGGGPKYQLQYWRVNVQGTAPGGSVSRVEMVAGVLKGN